MTDCRRTDLKRQWLFLLLLCASLAGLRAQCSDLPVFGQATATVERGCHQFSAAALPEGSGACFQVAAGTGAPVPETMLPALAAALEAGGGVPAVTSACGGNVEVCVNDELLTPSPAACDQLVRVRRTFTARNLAPAASTAPAFSAREISFIRPQLNDLEGKPTALVVIPDTGGGLPENPAPQTQDYPFVQLEGRRVHLAPAFCQFSVVYQDGPRNVGCGNNFTFIRTYTVTDACADNDNRVFTQVVRVGDQQEQIITPPIQVIQPLRFATNTSCGSVIDTRLTGLSIADICDGSSALDAYVYLNGNLSGTPLGPYPVFGPAPQPFTDPLPLGQHIVRYVGQDSYGATTTLDIDFEVFDNTPPNVLCVPSLAVALSATGRAVVRADRLDAGSSDDCSAVTLSLARAGSDGQPLENFSAALNFDCGDAGVSNLLLQATDATGRNRSRCLVSVTTVDLTRPTCVAPPNTTLTCRAFADNLPQDIVAAFARDPAGTSALLDATFGAATGEDNCDGVAIDQVILGGLSNCGTGRLTRRFTANDGAGFTQAGLCQQIIDVQLYTEYSLQLPGSSEFTCAELPTPENLVLGDTGCELMVVTTDTDTLPNDGTACYELQFTHEIINWCEYDGVGDPLEIPNDPDGDGNQRPTVYLHIDAVSSATLTDDLATLDVDNDVRNGNELNDLVEAYGTSGRRGFFRYQHTVSVVDQSAPATVIPTPDDGQTITEDCLGGAILRFTATDDCVIPTTTIAIDVDVVDINNDSLYNRFDFREDRMVSPSRFTGDPTSGVEVFIRLLPIGRHLARVRTTDGCGNLTEQYVVLNIRDGKAPAPDCREVNTVALVPDFDFGGITSVFAEDFITGPATVCTETAVTYAVYTEADAAQTGFVPSSSQTQLSFDCSDLGEQILRVYAFSEATGLHDFCNVSLTITSTNEAICAGRQGSLGGVIFTESGDPMIGVEVLTEGRLALSTQTDIDGSYYFDGLQEEEFYAVRPYYNENPINGISTFDISEISQYLLGEDINLTPYQYIAADANRSGSITIVDLLEIRGVLLGIEDNFDNNTSWRFVAADYVFPVPDNPWTEAFPETASFPDLTGHQEADFIAVKIGDINGSARPSGSSFGPAGESGSNGRHSSAANLVLRANTGQPLFQELWLAQSQATFAGLQLSLRLPPGTTVHSAQFSSALFTVDHENTLHFSYAAGLDGPLAANQPLFEFRSADLTTPRLLRTGRLLAEAYDRQGKIYPLQLVTTDDAVPAPARVFPNPVSEQTSLRYFAAEEAYVERTILNVNGQTLSYRTWHVLPGENQQLLLRSDFGNTPGVYLVKLSSKDREEVLRIVVQ